MRNRRDQQGFTLMELMVVIVIVAILAAVAVPLYINYVNDAKRTEAKGAIAAVISAEQVYYQEHTTYTDDMTLLKVDLDEVNRNWIIDIAAADADGFTITASGQDDGSAPGLEVQCVYNRTEGVTWSDEIAGGGGGGL